MYTINILIIALLIAVIEARGGDLKGAVADKLEQKPADTLTSLSAEITKSDVEITLGGKIAEDIPTDSVEANDDSKIGETPENLTKRKLEQEAAGVNSAEDGQRITHTSDDNASFIHVKEKIARQSSVEDYDEADELQRDENSDKLKNENEPKQASDDIKNAEEEADSELLDKKEVEVSAKSDPVGVDDAQDLFKFDADDLDEDLPSQSRRMLSFDPKLLDAMNIPKAREPEVMLGARSGQNDYKYNPAGINVYDRRHREFIDGETDNRSGHVSDTNPLVFSPLRSPTLPPPPLFRYHGQPHPHFYYADNTEKQSHSSDRSLLNPGFTNPLKELPHIDGNHISGVNQHFQTTQQLFPQTLEQIKPVETLQHFHLPQTLQHKPPLQPSQLSSTFQSFQPSHFVHSFESWQPVSSFGTIRPPQPSSLVISSSRSGTSFQPSQMKLNSILPTLHDVTQPVNSEISNQFSSGVYSRNWSWNT